MRYRGVQVEVVAREVSARLADVTSVPSLAWLR